jgi:hypothetical protein
MTPPKEYNSPLVIHSKESKLNELPEKKFKIMIF